MWQADLPAVTLPKHWKKPRLQGLPTLLISGGVQRSQEEKLIQGPITVQNLL